MYQSKEMSDGRRAVAARRDSSLPRAPAGGSAKAVSTNREEARADRPDDGTRRHGAQARPDAELLESVGMIFVIAVIRELESRRGAAFPGRSGLQ